MKATQAYSRSEVRRILKIAESRLRSWERRGLCERRNEFGFADLIALRTILHLQKSRIPPNRIQDSLSALSKKLPAVERPLSELKLVSAGRRVAAELPGGKMDALTGQMLFDFEPPPPARIQAIPQSSDKNPLARLQEAESWFREGLDLEERGAPTEAAIEAYRRALKLNPNVSGAWVNLGTLCYRLGDYQEAEHCYRQALRATPDYPLAHFNLGNICEEMERFDEAISHYKIALRLQPTYADAHYNLALVYERTREPMRAAKHWRSYLKLDPASPWATIARQQLSSLLQVTPGGRSDQAV